MADERAAKKPRVSAGGEDDQAAEPANPWRHACADVVSFHLLESVTEAGLAEEMKRGGTEVQGEFFHQHFGEEEQISGYKGLKVKLWMSVRTYHVWVEISHTARKQGFDQIVQVRRARASGAVPRHAARARFRVRRCTLRGAVSRVLRAAVPCRFSASTFRRA